MEDKNICMLLILSDRGSYTILIKLQQEDNIHPIISKIFGINSGVYLMSQILEFLHIYSYIEVFHFLFVKIKTNAP